MTPAARVVNFMFLFTFVYWCERRGILVSGRPRSRLSGLTLQLVFRQVAVDNPMDGPTPPLMI